MTGNVCLEMPELSHLAAEPLICSQRARAVIDSEKLDLEIELAARRFAPSESIFDSVQREAARIPVLAFFDAAWVALARDELSKPGGARLNRDEITQRVYQIFLEEGWLASYMRSETRKLFDHLVDSVPQGTNARWRIFALDKFFEIDGRRLAELEKRARERLVQAIRAEESAAVEVQPAEPTKSTGGEPPSTEEGVEETQQPSQQEAGGESIDLAAQQSPEPVETFGERLKRLRTANNMTQDDLARETAIDRSNISKYENDKLVPHPEQTRALANALEVDATYLSVTKAPQ